MAVHEAGEGANGNNEEKARGSSGDKDTGTQNKEKGSDGKGYGQQQRWELLGPAGTAVGFSSSQPRQGGGRKRGRVGGIGGGGETHMSLSHMAPDKYQPSWGGRKRFFGATVHKPFSGQDARAFTKRKREEAGRIPKSKG